MSTYISDIFDNPYSNHTVALVSTGRKIRAGVIDLDGKWLLEPRYRMITRWGGRYLEVEKENRKRDFWDSKTGRFISDSLGLNVNNLLVTSSGKTFFVFYNRGNIGLAAEDGTIVFPARYWSILPLERTLSSDRVKDVNLLTLRAILSSPMDTMILCMDSVLNVSGAEIIPHTMFRRSLSEKARSGSTLTGIPGLGFPIELTMALGLLLKPDMRSFLTNGIVKAL